MTAKREDHVAVPFWPFVVDAVGRGHGHVDVATAGGREIMTARGIRPSQIYGIVGVMCS